MLDKLLLQVLGFAFIRIVATADYNEIVLASDHNKVLTMTDTNVGFRDRTSLEKADPRVFMSLEGGSIKIGDKFICKSPTSKEVKACRTKTAIGGKFTLLMEEGHAVLIQDNHMVLGPGPYDLNTDSYPAIVADSIEFAEGAYHLDVRKFVKNEIYEINPPQREFKE